jgi:serine/threonine-protein kinase
MNMPQANAKSSRRAPVLFGRYYLGERIARGGMSDIHIAKTVGLGGFQKPLVIKKLLPEFADNPRFVRRFLTEAKTLAHLNHQNVAKIIDMGVIDGEYFLALELIEGRNVAHLMSKAKKLNNMPSLELALHVIIELGRGLTYSHKKTGPEGNELRLVHQDVNAFNVMISYGAEVKIIDFGIARVFLDSDSWHGLPIAGKLLYFSPEQLKGGEVDRRVDIYGAGVLLYELITGNRLFQHKESVEETVKAILQLDIRDRLKNDPLIPPDINPILVRAIALDPADRYPWMDDMLADVRAVIRKRGLELNVDQFAAYMAEVFDKERVLDHSRMVRLMRAGEIDPEEGSSPPSVTDSGVGKPAETPAAIREGENTEELLHLETGIRDAMESVEVPASRFRARTMTLRAGELLFRQNDPATDFYIVQSGSVKVYVKSGNARQTIAVLGKGAFLGESALLRDGKRFSSARALEDSSLIRIDKHTLVKLIPQDLSRKLILRLVDKLKDRTSLLAGALLTDPLSRLIYGLLFLYRRKAVHSGRDLDINELTELFGLEDRSQVDRYLMKLESLRIIDFDDQNIEVKNLDKLENLLKLLAGGGEFTMKL